MLCCLISNCCPACCLAAKSSGDSPANCVIPAAPGATTGTPDCATICVAKSVPKSSINFGGSSLFL